MKINANFCNISICIINFITIITDCVNHNGSIIYVIKTSTSNIFSNIYIMVLQVMFILNLY